MSCILYPLANYRKLASTPAVQAIWQRLLTSYYESPAAFCGALFELNADAYRTLYARDGEDELNATVEAMRNAPRGEEFDDYHREAARGGTSPRAHAALWEAFRRIRYQCSDATDRRERPIFWHLGWAMDECSRKMIEAITNPDAPEPTTLTASLRAELNLMNRTADDSPDFGAADVICKAAIRAERFLKQLERSIEQEQQTPALAA